MLDDGERVVGYTLVCDDYRGYEAWSAGAALQWLAATAGSAVGGRVRGDAATFARLRLQDGWRALRPD